MAHVLVVDDKTANRDLVAYLFAYYGHKVTTAADGALAVHIALSERPDLVVMDIAMPGMDGYTAARLMRGESELDELPLVAVSATSTASLSAARAAGFDWFYPLPIDPEDFVTKFEPFLWQTSASRPAGGDDD